MHEASSLAPPSLPPQPSTNPLLPPPFDHEELLVDLFEDLHTSQPTHPIFGSPAMGMLRLPLRATRSNGQCWINVAKRISRGIRREMGRKLGGNTCWMSAQPQLQITRPRGNHGVDVLIQVTVVRLLAFLAAPTATNWDKLCPPPPARAIDSPFSHTCSRGGPRIDQISSAVCLNGIYHGRFASREEIESHKLCSNGARALCPSHGDPLDLIKCVFTHPDGTIMPCRMEENCVPMCNCGVKCFGT